MEELQVVSCSFGSDGNTVVTASDDSTLKIWNLASRNANPIVCHSKSTWMTSCDLSKSEAIAVSGGIGGDVVLWDAVNGKKIARLARHTDVVHRVQISHDETTALSCGDDVAKFFHLPSRTHTLTLDHNESVVFGNISVDGGFVSTCTEDGTTSVWDTQSGKCIACLSCLALSCAFDNNNSVLLCGLVNGTVQLRDIRCNVNTDFKAHDDQVVCAWFIPNSNNVISCDDSGIVCLWDFRTAVPATALNPHENNFVSDCRVSRCGKRFVTCSPDCLSAKVWALNDLSKPKLVASQHNHQQWRYPPQKRRREAQA